MVKHLPTMRENWVQSLGQEDLLEKCREQGIKKVEKCLQTRLSTRAEHSCKQDVLPSVGN